MSTHESRWQEFGRLMAAAQSGDKNAYRKLLAELSRELESFVNYKAGFLGRSEDVVQDVLIAIDRAKHTYDPGRAFRPWVMAIARNKITDYVRKSCRDAKYVVDDEVALENAVAAEAQIDDRLELLRVAVESLDEKYRTVLELTKIKELSVRETADQLGLSESAVKTRASRGFKMLRKKMERFSNEV